MLKRIIERVQYLAAQPMIGFSILVVALSWFAASVKTSMDAADLRQESIIELRGYASLLEQDVIRAVEDVDRTLKYIRRSYERSDYKVEWAQLLNEDFTVNARTVQMAVTDAAGRMISSTAQPYPTKVVDLSDRAHFKYHVGDKPERLFISQPVVGRASGKTSVQFTRPYWDKDGKFAGVLVASLAPEAMVAAFHKIRDLASGRVAVIGDDGIVRAAAGLDAAEIGKAYQSGENPEVLTTRSDGTQVVAENVASGRRLATMKNLQPLPLQVATSLPAGKASGNWVLDGMRYYVMAAVFSIGTILIGFGAHRKQRQHVRQIATLAHTDPLTGLFNRLQLQFEFDLLANDETSAFIIHLIDLDHFKDVNDTYGHLVGDKLLKAAAARIQANVRDNDQIFRLGGDEFAIMQRGVETREAATTVARRLCAALCKPYQIDGYQVVSGASIGSALWSDSGQDRIAILKCADAALYKAKALGRGTYEVFGIEMNDAIASRRRLELELRSALELNQLELYYQPKYATGRQPTLIGYEALVRWQHPERGMVPPVEFIGMAEETGLIVPIGAWILERACKDIQKVSDKLTVAVNVSAVQFSGEGIVESVLSALTTSRLSPHRLEIEITESMLIKQSDRVVQQLEELRSRGIRVALDDFGTGYSSLGYLQKYPVDTIKIDRSFVSRIGADKESGPIIRAIIAMASELGLSTVAEGVETVEQLKALTEFQCTTVQGYYFSPPRPAAEAFSPSRLEDRPAWVA